MSKSIWQSKKFWMAICAAILTFADKMGGMDGLTEVAYPLMVYIFGQGVADLGKSLKG